MSFYNNYIIFSRNYAFVIIFFCIDFSNSIFSETTGLNEAKIKWVLFQILLFDVGPKSKMVSIIHLLTGMRVIASLLFPETPNIA